MFDINNILTII